MAIQLSDDGTQTLLLNGAGLPVACGKILPCERSAGSYYVQTPDELWDLMFQRMKRQVGAREGAMTKWERSQGKDAQLSEGYWDRYGLARAQYRVDYPMPWGHIMFGKEG